MGRRVRPAHLVMEHKILGQLGVKNPNTMDLQGYSGAMSLFGRAVAAEASLVRATIVVMFPVMPMPRLLSCGVANREIQDGLLS